MFVSLRNAVDKVPEVPCTLTASSLDPPNPALGTGEGDRHAQFFADSGGSRLLAEGVQGTLGTEMYLRQKERKQVCLFYGDCEN